MAKKKSKATKKKPKPKTTTEPKFPYVNNTNSLRQFLKDVPNKPKPPKLTYNVLESWGYTSTNVTVVESHARCMTTLKTTGTILIATTLSFLFTTRIRTFRIWNAFVNKSKRNEFMAELVEYCDAR